MRVEEVTAILDEHSARVLVNGPKDTQVGGDHYKDMIIQPSEFISKNNLGWYEGNAIKYISRHKQKGGKQDLEKALHYLQLAINEYYGTI